MERRSRAALGIAATMAICVSVSCSAVGNQSTRGPAASAAASEAASTQPTVTATAPTTPTIEATPTAQATAPPAVPTVEPTDPKRPSPPPTIPPECCDGEVLPPPSFAGGLEASDEFWNQWFDSCWFGAGDLPASIAEVYSEADLVVRGNIVDLYIGEYWHMTASDFSDPLAYVRVQVDEVLMGEPESRTPGFVEVQIGHAFEAMYSLRSKLPDHEHLWFLTWDGHYERGPLNQSEIAPFAYFAPDYKLPTILRNIDGKIQIIKPGTIKRAYGGSQFPLPLDGTSFEALLDNVRALANAKTRPSPEPEPITLAAC